MICIHTVIYNELDEYLKVWLDYHTKMVDHIFIFEDIGSKSHKHITDNYENVTLLNVLELYDEKLRPKIIELKEKGETLQGYYIMRGILRIQSLDIYEWCFAIDIDEFITLQEPYDAISSVLSEFQDYDGIIVQWQNFGANGHVYKPNYNGRDYREFYTEKSPFNSFDKKFHITTKVVYNLRKIKRSNICGVHVMNGNWVNTRKKKDREEIVYDKIYLAHYVTKSWEEYVWKLYKRGMHCKNRHRSDRDFFQINPSMKDRYDELQKIKNNVLNA